LPPNGDGTTGAKSKADAMFPPTSYSQTPKKDNQNEFLFLGAKNGLLSMEMCPLERARVFSRSWKTD